MCRFTLFYYDSCKCADQVPLPEKGSLTTGLRSQHLHVDADMIPFKRCVQGCLDWNSEGRSKTVEEFECPDVTYKNIRFTDRPCFKCLRKQSIERKTREWEQNIKRLRQDAARKHSKDWSMMCSSISVRAATTNICTRGKARDPTSLSKVTNRGTNEALTANSSISKKNLEIWDEHMKNAVEQDESIRTSLTRYLGHPFEVRTFETISNIVAASKRARFNNFATPSRVERTAEEKERLVKIQQRLSQLILAHKSTSTVSTQELPEQGKEGDLSLGMGSSVPEHSVPRSRFPGPMNIFSTMDPFPDSHLDQEASARPIGTRPEGPVRRKRGPRPQRGQNYLRHKRTIEKSQDAQHSHPNQQATAVQQGTESCCETCHRPLPEALLTTTRYNTTNSVLRPEAEPFVPARQLPDQAQAANVRNEAGPTGTRPLINCATERGRKRK